MQVNIPWLHGSYGYTDCLMTGSSFHGWWNIPHIAGLAMSSHNIYNPTNQETFFSLLNCLWLIHQRAMQTKATIPAGWLRPVKVTWEKSPGNKNMSSNQRKWCMNKNPTTPNQIPSENAHVQTVDGFFEMFLLRIGKWSKSRFKWGFFKKKIRPKVMSPASCVGYVPRFPITIATRRALFWPNETIFHRPKLPWNKGICLPQRSYPLGAQVVCGR